MWKRVALDQLLNMEYLEGFLIVKSWFGLIQLIVQLELILEDA